MKVLVTGASGMLGRAVASTLAVRGDEVTVFQRRPSDLDGVVAHEVRGDITDPASVLAAAAGVEAIVHLAARVSVVGPWGAFQSTNVEGTRHVVDAARRVGARRLVHISSPSVAHLGSSLVGVGAGPADVRRARGGYARSKAWAERVALEADGDGLAVTALRPHLVWGPGDAQLVGRIVERARAGRLALVGTGIALVDTTYIDNAADAIVAAVDRAEHDAVHGRAFVVSNGQPRTVTELFTRICTAAGVAPPSRHVPLPVARAGGAVLERLWTWLGRDDPPMTSFLAEQLATAHWFDQRQTRSALSWTPEVDLEDGFDRLTAWHRAQSSG